MKMVVFAMLVLFGSVFLAALALCEHLWRNSPRNDYTPYYLIGAAGCAILGLILLEHAS